MGRPLRLTQRLAVGVTPFMVFGTVRIEDDEDDGDPKLAIIVQQGNRWALEALESDSVTWQFDDAIIRVVFTQGDIPSKIVEWDDFVALVSDCPGTRAHFFGTIGADGTLHVRLIIARVSCQTE